jgi:hypothetical protein
MMPSFDPESGYLPAGVHAWTWPDFASGFTWTQRRRFLLGGLYRALRNLRGAGCSAAVVDGSYVTAKDMPEDFDAAFDTNGVNGQLVDPVLLRHTDGRKAMRAKYFGDMFPWSAVASVSSGMNFVEFFQQDREGRPKGVVLLNVRDLP